MLPKCFCFVGGVSTFVLDVISVYLPVSESVLSSYYSEEYLVMDLDLFACDETGVQFIFVQKFPLPHASMAAYCSCTTKPALSRNVVGQI